MAPKTMIDNFEQIGNLLEFGTEDDFYHLQILKRKKEHPELGSNSYVVKTYYIRSLEYLLMKREEIIALCKFHNARGCINLNKRSFEKVAFHVLRKVTDQILNKDYKSVRKAYESVCGAHSNETKKKWILDCDFVKSDDFMNRLHIYLNTIKPEGNKILTTLTTKNGFHVITNPFNIQEFEQRRFAGYDGVWLKEPIDIHKDNPSILYIP